MTQLKDLLKPPFRIEGRYIKDQYGYYLIRLYNDEIIDRHPEWISFIWGALNEKWERDFGEKQQIEIDCQKFASDLADALYLFENGYDPTSILKDCIERLLLLEDKP